MTDRLSDDKRYIVFSHQPKIVRQWLKIRYRGDNWYSIYRWIERNTYGYWAVNGTMIYFKSIEDAMAFKLRWI